MTGSISRQEITGKLKGKLQGIAKLLGASVTADGKFKINKETFINSPYDLLPSYMKDELACRKEIVMMLLKIKRQAIQDEVEVKTRNQEGDPPNELCKDPRARNHNQLGKCKFGYFYGHEDPTKPGVKYMWPSPWNSGGYVWCDIPNHDMLLYGLGIAEGKIEYIGHDRGIKKWAAKYWSQDCTPDVFLQKNY